jgi:hypothetical protein
MSEPRNGIPAGPARPPSAMHPTDAALQALDQTRDMAAATFGAVQRLEELVERQHEPAHMSTIVLTASNPIVSDRERDRDWTRSIALLNPTSIPIFLGVGGNTASLGGRVPSVPPNALLSLPLAAVDLDVGATPADLAAGDAVVFLFRMNAVIPPYLYRTF